MRPYNALTRITQAFQFLATGGSEDQTSRGDLFEEVTRNFEQFKNWWKTESKMVTAAYLALDTDHTIRVDATAAAVVVTLPAAASVTGMALTIKKIDVTANAVTVTPNGVEKIDGAATWTTTVQYAKVTIQSNGVNWDVIS